MLLRFFGYFFGIGAALFVIAAAVIGYFIYSYSEDLPDYTVLRQYQPPIMTRIHAGDGQLVAEYAHERRLYLPIQAIPELIKNAFISAEDKNFYSHAGLDFQGIGRAVVVNFQNMGSNRRPIGASTITQQVAKNFLLTNEATIDRKIREALISLRIEKAFTKDKILELYLNEI
ncbi:MAG: transglycosylase domain-containing protein, partial [Hyphomicrobiales bacterium]|nr:transglycosylase domain-containing protein [Hyphomicrobiales bacterium]